MQSARTPTNSVYTTTPISFSGAISRSFQNLTTFLSGHRPWPEFLSEFNRPDSLPTLTSRLRLNSKYFAINYAILISLSAAASLLSAPLSLIIIASLYVLWLVLFFFREDQIVIGGSHVSDQAVMLVLGLVSVLVVWFTGVLNSLLVGISVGILIAVGHGVFRNPEGLFLDENDAMDSGLIGSNVDSNVYRI